MGLGYVSQHTPSPSVLPYSGELPRAAALGPHILYTRDTVSIGGWALGGPGMVVSPGGGGVGAGYRVYSAQALPAPPGDYTFYGYIPRYYSQFPSFRTPSLPFGNQYQGRALPGPGGYSL